MPRRDDDFYVGYLPQAPRGLAAFVRRVVGPAAIAAVALAVVVAMAQSQLDVVTFEFGHPRRYTGTITTDPIPALRLRLPGGHPVGSGATRIALVGQGKRGAFEDVAHHGDHQVELEGALVYRNAEVMLELVPGSVRHLDTVPEVEPGRPESLGTVTLRGEIVDAKCYLGVMNPGSSVVHRACAIRCLSGGIPPILALADTLGRTMVWLATPQGAPVSENLLAHVAEPISLTGELVAYENHLVMVPDLSTLTRVR
jgi:hypothetical protein